MNMRTMRRKRYENGGYLDILDEKAEFALLDNAGCKYYLPLNVKIPCKNFGDVFEMQLLVETVASEDQFRSVLQAIKHGIEGVTYSGGEPTLQQNLPELTKAIQALGLGVISFTGHLYEQAKEQLEGCDMVLDGAFEEAKLETKRKILGSTNKRILCLTDRYKKHMDWFLAPPSKSIEINVGSTIFANGDKI